MKQKCVSHYDEIEAFITKDGSVIRELMHPSQHVSKQQSLAEARLPIGRKTLLHKHHNTEELYYITQGKGLMTLAEEKFEVGPGDTVCITPGTLHCIENIGESELALLCCCSPPYSHEDTEIVEGMMA